MSLAKPELRKLFMNRFKKRFVFSGVVALSAGALWYVFVVRKNEKLYEDFFK